MSGLFELLHGSRPVDAVEQVPADVLKRNQLADTIEDMQKTPQAKKSHQEFEEEDDVEVDKLTISDVGPDEPLSRQNMKVPDIYDIEDFVPNADNLIQ